MPNGAFVRIVIDTNVLLSGLIWHGPPHALLERFRSGAITLVISPTLLVEFAGVIARAKFQAILARSNIAPEALLAGLGQLAEIVTPPALPAPVSRDPDDDAVLALAVAAKADLIVSGDRHLLTIGSHTGIAIVSPAAALALID